MKLVIHQLVPVLHRRDAVGEHTFHLRDLLRDRDVTSDIYVEIEDPQTCEETLSMASLSPAKDVDLLVYQMSTGSEMANMLLERGDNLVVNYHNVTPAEYFAPWDNALALHQERARRECALLSKAALLAVGVSEFNRSELEALGYERTVVIPPAGMEVPQLPHLRDVKVAADEGGEATGTLARTSRSEGMRGTKWLSVGRLAPNKAIEDTMAALLAFRMSYDPDATLTVVGKPAVSSYYRALLDYSTTLGLDAAVRFTGSVSDDELEEFYRHCDVFVSTSQHEGFCLPLVEAMANGLAVVAVSNAAIPEVLGDAGTLLLDNDPTTIADAVAAIARDNVARDRHVAAGRKRLVELGLADAGSRMVDLLINTARTKKEPH